MQAAANAVLKSLAHENANNDCKKALDLIHNRPNVELADYIKACANIGSEQYKVELIATAIAQQLQEAKATVKCFACGDEEHVQKQCPKGQKINKKPNKPFPPCKKALIGITNATLSSPRMVTLQKQGNFNRGSQTSASQPNWAQFSQPPMQTQVWKGVLQVPPAWTWPSALQQS